MKPFLVLNQKHWLTGVSGSSNSGIGGIFKNSAGVSAIRGIGTWNQDDVGLLQAGPSGVNVGSGVVVDTPICAAREPSTGTTSYMWIMGDGGHIYRKDNTSSGAAVDYGASNQIPSPASGIGILRIGATPYLYYFQEGQIGRVSLASVPAVRTTGWTDGWQTGLVSTKLHPVHNFLDKMFFGNDYNIGHILDNSGSESVVLDALDLPQQFRVFALEDDGQFLVASISTDKGDSTGNVESKIIFWDTNSSSWNNEYPVRDNIIDLKRSGSVIYGIGLRGIYEISYGGGVRKIWQKGGAYSALISRGGSILSSFNDALVMGADYSATATGGNIGILGRPDPTLPYAYHTPIQVDGTGTYFASFVDSEFINGYVLVGSTDDTLKTYPLAYVAGQQATGVSAETVRIPLDTTFQLRRVDVILGSPLASGDSLTVEIRKNDMTTDTTVGTVSYATHGAKRRVVLTNFSVECEEIILTLTFGGGAVKVKRVEFFGEPLDTKTA